MNLNKALFPGIGPYDIPPIEPVTDYPTGDFLPISDAMTEKSPEGKNLHCFVDDYRFARLWNTPDRYIPILQRFRAVCSPDFSTYTDMPVAMQIYNHYRKHWCAAYWQLHGLTVYPTISWSTPDSYTWCFDGEPVGGIVAVSSVGTQADKESKDREKLDAERAAFYDRSLEDVTENLRSFLKGNYENDAAFGVSCTETTRNTAANKLDGKSFADLSEE